MSQVSTLHIPETVKSSQEYDMYVRQAYAHIIGYLKGTLGCIEIISNDPSIKSRAKEAVDYCEEIWNKSHAITLDYSK